MSTEPATTYPTKQCDGPRCTAQIIWTLSARNKPTPVDPVPTLTGTIKLNYSADGRLCSRVATKKEQTTTGFGAKRYVSHWATCVDADYFRRKYGPLT